MVRRIETLLVWQAARRLAAEVYRATRSHAFARDLGLRLQVRAAATTIMTSLAVGYERKGGALFSEGLQAAAVSAAELFALICVAEDVGLLSRPSSCALQQRIVEVRRVIDLMAAAVAKWEAARRMYAGEMVN